MAITRRLPANPDDVRMSFGEHLEELRWRLIKAIIALGIAAGVCFYFGSEIFHTLTIPYEREMRANGYVPDMITTDPTELFMLYFKIGLIFGLGISAPYGLYQLWRFVAAGLYPNERRWVVMFAPASMVLFFAGIGFFVKLVLPLALNYLIGVTQWYPRSSEDALPHYTTSQPATAPARIPVLRQAPSPLQDGMMWVREMDGALNVVVGGHVLRYAGVESDRDSLVRPQYRLGEYMDFVLGMCLAFGLGFQIPIVIVVLVLLRIVSAAQLSRSRKVIILVLVTAGAVLTPSGDVTSQLLLAGPMFGLFELGLLAARVIERKRKTQEAADA